MSDIDTRDGVILRARLLLAIDLNGVQPRDLEDDIADAIRRVVESWGGVVRQIQLSVAIDPAWASEGPDDRWTSRVFEEG